MSPVVRVIAPIGRDAALISTFLEQNGVAAQPLTPGSALDGTEEDSLGPLLLTEEALSTTLSQQLKELVQHQPPWSDLPILILTSGGREGLQSHQLNGDRLPLGAILLERPIRPATLLSSIQAALRARARQYEIRETVTLLKHERETLQTVLDNLPTGVSVANPAGEIILRNRQISLMFPSSSTQNVKSTWPIFSVDGHPVATANLPLYKALRTAEPVPPEDFLHERAPGTRTWIRIAAVPILDEAGHLTGAVAAVSDIDHQKRAELALIQSEKLAAVGRLAASISHEINNPLEAVTNLLYLARHSGPLPDEVRNYLNAADSELARVSQIASHTLRFHRQSTRQSAISPKELLEPTLGLFSGRIINSAIKLIVEDRHASPVLCHDGEIRQVLNNLVGNAIDAMRNGGRLRIRSANTRLWKTGAPAVRITVADTGHGMTPEVARKVFEAFYTTKGINGTGLGLWISSGIVEKHGGNLRLRSSTHPKKGGTVFSLILPLSPPPIQPKL